MKGIVGATLASTGMWLFAAAIWFRSPTLVVLCVLFLVAGCWVLFGPPVPEDEDDGPMV